MKLDTKKIESILRLIESETVKNNLSWTLDADNQYTAKIGQSKVRIGQITDAIEGIDYIGFRIYNSDGIELLELNGANILEFNTSYQFLEHLLGIVQDKVLKVNTTLDEIISNLGGS